MQIALGAEAEIYEEQFKEDCGVTWCGESFLSETEFQTA